METNKVTDKTEGTSADGTDDGVENFESEMDRTMRKLQLMEEENARQAAKMAMEEKRLREMEVEKKRLELEVQRQHDLLQ